MVIQSFYQEDDDQASLADDGLPEIFDHHYEPLNWEYPPSRCDSIVLYLVLLALCSNRTLKLWTVVSGLTLNRD